VFVDGDHHVLPAVAIEVGRRNIGELDPEPLGPACVGNLNRKRRSPRGHDPNRRIQVADGVKSHEIGLLDAPSDSESVLL